jgi:hypothetical protein
MPHPEVEWDVISGYLRAESHRQRKKHGKKTHNGRDGELEELPKPLDLTVMDKAVVVAEPGEVGCIRSEDKYNVVQVFKFPTFYIL